MLLAGLRVLDLARVLAGPLCTMMLGDVGADVLKDVVVQAERGWMAVNGDPDGAPLRAGVALVDVVTGKDAAIAILDALVSGQDARRWGNAHSNLVPYQLFAAADRPIVVAVGNDAQWQAGARTAHAIRRRRRTCRTRQNGARDAGRRRGLASQRCGAERARDGSPPAADAGRRRGERSGPRLGRMQG